MKKFVVKLLLFLLFLLVADRGVGYLLEQMYNKANSGNVYKNIHVARHLEEDLLVMGSSRAYHHYMPSVLAQETSLSSFNGGIRGNGTVFGYGLYLAARTHHIPKVVLIDVFYEFDLFNTHSNERFLDLLKPFYSETPDLQDYFAELDAWSPLEMSSWIYRYNSQFFAVLKDVVRSSGNNDWDGFEPFSLESFPKTQEKSSQPLVENFDAEKIGILERMITQMKQDGARVVLVFSPIWRHVEGASYLDTIAAIAKRQQIEFWDYSREESLEVEMFADYNHLNNKGAEKYSRMIGRRLKAKVLEWKLVDE